jgi:hypothetical protein
MRVFSRVLQAIGIAEVIIGLVTGLNGDMAREMYSAVAGIVVFAVGWLIQRRTEKRTVLN